MPTKPDRTLVVVADGHKAILFRNVGRNEQLELREERRLVPRDLQRDGPSGSRPPDQTPRQTDEATFAKQLAGTLHEMKQAGDFDDLILAADPQTLGQLRSAMHESVEKCVIRSVAKELTNHPTQDIADALSP